MKRKKKQNKKSHSAAQGRKYSHSITVIESFFLIDQEQHAVHCPSNSTEGKMTPADQNQGHIV